MIHILKPFLALCAVLFPLFVYGQEDTLNADGLFPKYNKRYYQMSEYPKLPLELKKKWMFGERRFPVSNGYDRVIASLLKICTYIIIYTLISLYGLYYS